MGAEVEAVVSFGSNIEPRARYISLALKALERFPDTQLCAASSVVETEGVDVPREYADMKFLNQVAVFATSLEVHEFSRRMHEIEDMLGRVRMVRNGPRTIDIDLIDFGGMSLCEADLTLPHPRAHARDFVMSLWREVGAIRRDKLIS